MVQLVGEGGRSAGEQYRRDTIVRVIDLEYRVKLVRPPVVPRNKILYKSGPIRNTVTRGGSCACRLRVAELRHVGALDEWIRGTEEYLSRQLGFMPSGGIKI